jgi:hypothetical protein
MARMSTADPAFDDFISRNSPDAESVAARWPRDVHHPRAAFHCCAFPAIEGLTTARVSPVARWDDDPAEFFLDWNDVCAAADTHAALAFARSVFRAASGLGGWDDRLTGSITGTAPPAPTPSAGAAAEDFGLRLCCGVARPA